MNIKIAPLDINSDLQINSLVKWDNDLELAHFIHPVRNKDSSPKVVTFDNLKASYSKDPVDNFCIYMIFDDSKPIGNFSIQLDPKHLLKKIEGTSWLGLTIGEKKYWGKGIAQMAMERFELESRRLGAIRVELGTFEFNYRAQAFYKKLGYKEIGRLEKFTYWKNRFWDDIRMEKIL